MPDRSPTFDFRNRPRLGGGRAPGTVAVVIAMSALLVGSLVACGRAPSRSIPSASSSVAASASAGTSPSTTPAPRLQPTPEPEATPWPDVESMAPAQDDVLSLAGRDGVPGMLRCESFGSPFTFASLANPTGAEERVVPNTMRCERSRSANRIATAASARRSVRSPATRLACCSCTNARVFASPTAVATSPSGSHVTARIGAWATMATAS